MEVFHMNTYEINEIKRAVESVIGGASASYGRHEPARSRTHDWDYIVRMVCTGCGSTLGQFEIRHNLGFCFRCRRFLFPETVGADKQPSGWPLRTWQRAGR